MAKHLFHERRYREGRTTDFVLNRPPFDKARILVAGKNFGSGSSREQAVWALADFGIRCVIAPSFGEIFYNNCFKNGVLPIVMTGTAHEQDHERRAIGRAYQGRPRSAAGRTSERRLAALRHRPLPPAHAAVGPG